MKKDGKTIRPPKPLNEAALDAVTGAAGASTWVHVATLNGQSPAAGDPDQPVITGRLYNR